jgi:hypothetical protein
MLMRASLASLSPRKNAARIIIIPSHIKNILSFPFLSFPRCRTVCPLRRAESELTTLAAGSRTQEDLLSTSRSIKMS